MTFFLGGFKIDIIRAEERFLPKGHIKLAVPAKKNSNSGENQWFMVLQDHIQAI